MKLFVAIIGLALLAYPLARHLSLERRLEESDSAVEVLSNLVGISGGLMIGFVGVMVLGILVDGGRGYRKPALLGLLALLGIAWTLVYPSGWLLGVPLMIYPVFHRLGLAAR